MKEIAEELAYQTIQENNPELLKIIHTFVQHGLSPARIVEVCAERTDQPAHRLAFIGCAAEYLINNPPLITEKIQ